MNRIRFVRADGNDKIGLGHIYRTMAIASSMWDKDNIIFLLADERALKLVKEKGFKAIVLGTSYDQMEEETDILFDKVKDYLAGKTDILVDSYFVTDSYLEKLREYFRVTYIDDFGKKAFPVDVLINYSIYAEDIGYEKLYEGSSTKLCLGISYSPVRDEFKNSSCIRLKDKVTDIMVTTGGGDQLGFELKFLEYLLSCKELLDKDYVFHLIVGPVSKDADKIKEFLASCKELENKIVVHENVKNMATVMENMDACIAASGSTLYELCRLGIPTICFVVADNQMQNVMAFERKAFMINAGNFNQDEIKVFDNIRKGLLSLEDIKVRKTSTDKMKSLFEGENSGGRFKALIAFLLTVVISFFAILSLVVYVDPFFHYHKPLEGFPYIVDNQLSQNPGMAQNFIYDSAIIGSSMTVNFHTSDFGQILGKNTIKLSYSGALPRDDYNILSFIYRKDSFSRKHNDVSAIYMALDPMVMTADVDSTKYELPEYLYDDNIFNDVKYVFNRDVLFEYILKPVIQRKPTDLSTVYASWWTPEYYNEQWVLHNFTPSSKVEEETKKDEYIERTRKNLDINIIPFIKEHKETEFTIFLPPYSMLYWYNVMEENHLEATFNQIEFMCDTLMKYDNVKIFYFQNEEQFVTDINNYADTIHYKPEINTWMVKCFADNTHLLQKGDIKKELSKMRKIIKDYDFDALFSRRQG